MKKKGVIYLAVVIIAIVFISVDSFYTLDNAEIAIIERFGKLSATHEVAGLHFKLPFIDRVVIYKTNEVSSLQYGYRIKSEADPDKEASYEDVSSESIVLTRGAYLINIGAVIQYRITDPVLYNYKVDDQEGTIRLAFESVLRSNIQNQNLDDALINKDSIAQEILPDLIDKIKSYNLGISIVDVKLTDVLLPEAVQFAYDDVNIATNEKEEYKSKAEKYSNEMLPQARADAYKLVQGAEAYKAEKVSQAKGDVENFNQVYEKYKLSKQITKTRLYIETMQNVLKNAKEKYIIDSQNDGILKYLPIGGAK